MRPKAATIPNVVEVEIGDSEYARYLYIDTGNADVAQADTVAQGDRIGAAGAVGTSTPVIHLEVGTQPMSAMNGVTFPVTFEDYELLQGGAWVPIARGLPTTGDVVRRPRAPRVGTQRSAGSRRNGPAPRSAPLRYSGLDNA